jgi:AraC-like DNA-binding protein
MKALNPQDYKMVYAHHFYIFIVPQAFAVRDGDTMDNALIYFLQKMLQDTLSINFNYYRQPFSDISSIDIGLRKGLKDTELLYDNMIHVMNALDQNCFYFYCDGYLLNYIFFHPHANIDDVIVVGPYLKAPIDHEYINYIVLKHHLKHSEMESIRGLLHQIPVFDDNLRLVSVLVNIINYIRPGVSFSTIKYDNVLEENENINYTPIDNYMLNAQATENRYKLEEPLFQAIAKGDTAEALSITRHFMSMLYEPRINDALSDKKASLYSTNTMLRIGAGRSSVHPIFLHELSSKNVKLINNTDSITQLDKIHEKMVRDYCLLVQNKARSQYSKLVRDVLNYIDFNISQQLTLSVLADYFHLSPPYLSKIFKKELNTTITDYITNLRIHESLRLLSATTMQIQEVASYVGISDFNYYTKTFKKCIGCTPSEYRKNLKKG